MQGGGDPRRDARAKGTRPLWENTICGRLWVASHQDQLEYKDLLGYAADLCLDVEQFARAFEDPAVTDRIRADVASAGANLAQGPPTFLIGDQRYVRPYDSETLAW